MSDRPLFSVTPAILGLVAAIGELEGRLEASLPPERQPLLRRANQIRTIQAGYYEALNASNRAGQSTPFIHFMLQVIYDTLAAMGVDAARATEQVTDQVTEQVRRLLGVMDAKPASANDLMTRLRLRHRPYFTATYLDPALTAGLIVMTRPETPRSSRQQYRLTDRGRDLLART